MIRRMLILSVTAAALAGCTTYDFAYLNLSGTTGSVAVRGEGNKDLCEKAYRPARANAGPWVQVPASARVAGTVLVVRNGEDFASIPVYSWQEQDKTHFACNGPDPAFAIHETSLAEFTRAVSRRFRK
jgi:hypothetical protein